MISAAGSGWSLTNGDCIAGMRLLADKSVDVTISDPPYEAEAHTKGRRTKTGTSTTRSAGKGDWKSRVARGEAVASAAPLPFAAITECERTDSASEIARLTRRWALVFCQVEAAGSWAAALEVGGLDYVRTMVWIKPDAQPQFTGDRPGHGYESIVVAHRKGRKRWNGGGRVGVFTHCRARPGSPGGPGSEPSPHPTTKPLALMAELVSLFSDPGELVLDPFAGSGSTGVACGQLGRRFQGFELDAGYYEIACRRLRGEAARINPAQPDLFGSVTP